MGFFCLFVFFPLVCVCVCLVLRLVHNRKWRENSRMHNVGEKKTRRRSVPLRCFYTCKQLNEEHQVTGVRNIGCHDDGKKQNKANTRTANNGEKQECVVWKLDKDKIRVMRGFVQELINKVVTRWTPCFCLFLQVCFLWRDHSKLVVLSVKIPEMLQREREMQQEKWQQEWYCMFVPVFVTKTSLISHP